MLHTDASADGTGAALTQDYEGAERLVAYASDRWSQRMDDEALQISVLILSVGVTLERI